DCFLVLIFFFQAEDGIRDFHVTGVQTCALPICPDPPAPAQRHRERGRLARWDRSRVVLDEIARDVGPVEQRERLLRVRADLERLNLGDGAEHDIAAFVLDHHSRLPATYATTHTERSTR